MEAPRNNPPIAGNAATASCLVKGKEKKEKGSIPSAVKIFSTSCPERQNFKKKKIKTRSISDSFIGKSESFIGLIHRVLKTKNDSTEMDEIHGYKDSKPMEEIKKSHCSVEELRRTFVQPSADGNFLTKNAERSPPDTAESVARKRVKLVKGHSEKDVKDLKASVVNPINEKRHRDRVNAHHERIIEVPVKGLGAVPRKAERHLRTQIFNQLAMIKLINPQSENLDDIEMKLEKTLNKAMLGSLTFRDPEPTSEKTIDPHFLQLQKQSLKCPNPMLGGSFVNNYPSCMSKAQINCDAFHAELHPDYNFSVVADGCGWGLYSREAAQRATTAATDYINQKLGSICEVIGARILAIILVRSLAAAHEEIMKGKNEALEVGNTTINICLTFLNREGKRYVMTAGVGDCKGYLAVKDEKGIFEVREIAASDRLDFDAKDPGGRLGPCLVGNSIDPDLRNLSILCMTIPEKEYIIFNLTDGVYDNLNPEQLGKEPYEINSKLDSQTKWIDLPSEERLNLCKQSQNAILKELIGEAVALPGCSLTSICRKITSYCHDVTSNGRNAMKDISYKESSDRKTNPGKMDHCSVVAFSNFKFPEKK